MAVLLENVTNCVWQAFASLQQDKTGSVAKSKLKVLTANIGTLLDLYGVERGLEHFKSTTSLNFDAFKYYLQKEVFSSLPQKQSPSALRNYENNIAEICWLICRKQYINRDNKIFDDASIAQIFKIFCLLAELTPEEGGVYQVLLHPSEASHVGQQLASSLGSNWDEEDFSHLSSSIGSFRFANFVAVLESRCLNKVKDMAAISEAVTDLHQTFVEDVIKKGMLSMRGYIFPKMREYWCVLRPTELNYYKSRSEKDRCGSIPLEVGNRIEPKSYYKFVVRTSQRNFELGATDHMTRLQWISALQIAISHSGGQSYQRLQATKRRLQRQSRVYEITRAKALLQAERNARQAAEGQAKELEAVVKEESKKLCELEHIKEKLEKLLEEETQAKNDEEIVRALQARVLAEEWLKREELEKLQEEQRVLLEEERGKRKEYEELQNEKELALIDAQLKLEQLEEERKTLDEQLKNAHDKIKLSEMKKEALEARLLQVSPRREGEKIRRVQSFMPSTKDRPILLEVRAATLRRSSKQ